MAESIIFLEGILCGMREYMPILYNLAWSDPAVEVDEKNEEVRIVLVFNNQGNRPIDFWEDPQHPPQNHVPDNRFTVRVVLDNGEPKDYRFPIADKPEIHFPANWPYESRVFIYQGAAYIQRIYYNLSPGQHTLDAYLDVSDELEESDKENNHLHFEFSGPSYSLIREGGVLGNWKFKEQTVRLIVDRDVVPPDAVEFVLLTPSWVTWKKEMYIRESPSVGQGEWKIYTNSDRHEDRNGLYVYQLDRGRVSWKVQGDILGGMDYGPRVLSTTYAFPGSRITTIWASDGGERMIPDGYLRSGGIWLHPQETQILRIDVDRDVIPSDSVEFVLSDRKRLCRQEIVIHESASAGPGNWTIFTAPPQGRRP